MVEVESAKAGAIWASQVTWPIDLTHYIVQYYALAWIVDMQSGKEVFRGRCEVFSKRRPDLPTHVEMYAEPGGDTRKR